MQCTCKMVYKYRRFRFANSHQHSAAYKKHSTTMAKLSLSLLSFLVLLGFGFGYAIREQQLGECQLSNIDAREPSYRVQSEGGQTEFWDNQNNEFRCAGVSIRRHIIQQRGLLLPVYHNAPVLVYVVQGQLIAPSIHD